MAKKNKEEKTPQKGEPGYYSPEAIQARQQAVVWEYNKAQEEKKKVEKTETVQPTGIQSGGQLSPDKNPVTKSNTAQIPYVGTAGFWGSQKYNLPVVKQTNPNVPNTPPYMAQGIANVETILGTNGVEPIYYTGRPREGWQGTFDAVIGNPFKNWVRKTWANIHNPANYLPSPTAEQKKEIEERVQKLKDKPINYQGHEVSSDQRAKALQLIGLDLNEVLTAQATEDVARKSMEGGDKAVNTTLVAKTVKSVTGSAIMGVLSAPEWVVRNYAAVAKTVDDMADSVAGADKDRVQDYGVYTGVEKFKKALDENKTVEFMTKTLPAVMAPLTAAKYIVDHFDFLNVVKAVSPPEFLKDAGRLVVNMDKIPEGQFMKNLNSNLAGSQMIYTLLKDGTTAEEYKKRYEDGEDPQTLTVELMEWEPELLGGILFDPTTWTGADAVKYAEDGTRITSDVVKSAARANVENALLDVRPSRSITEAVDAFTEKTKGVATKQQILDSIQQAFKVTAEEFQVWKSKKGVSQLVSTDKQKLVIEQANDFFRGLAANAKGLPNAVDEMLATVNSMKKLARGGEGAEEAFTHLINGRLGVQALSPRGMRMASLLAGLDESVPSFAKAIETGDVKLLGNLYAEAMEKTVKKTILSVDEMAKAAQDAKKIIKETGETPELLKAIQDYKDLSPLVKFVNGANNIGKRTWMKPMGFLSQVYFGLNRFSYPTRNVLSAIPGMAYEFGLTTAIDTAVKSITGSQIEKLGVRQLEGMTGEIEKLIGFIPEAAMRGDTPIGEYVDVSKKWFGVVRGGGEVAQLSEQIMAANIMLTTIRREIKSAIRNGAIPAPSALVKAGLTDNDIKILFKYTDEYQGDVGRITEEFRKFMGGEEDAWRHIGMDNKLDHFLTTIGNGANDLKKELISLRDTAATKDEFMEGAQKVWQKVESYAEFSRTDPVNLSEDLVKEFGDDIKTAQMFQVGSPEAVNNFERIIQSFRNADSEFIQVKNKMQAWFADQGVQQSEYVGLMNSLDIAKKTPPAQVDSVRRLVNQISRNADITPAEIYDQLEKSAMKLSELTEVDPSKITPKQMKSIMWEAYFQFRGKAFADNINNYTKGMMGIFDSMADQLGTTVADAAKLSGAPVQKAVDSVDNAYKYYQQSHIDMMAFTRTNFPPGTTLMDLAVEDGALKSFGYSSKSHLFNSINKYRREHGLKPWQTFAQVDAWEVQDALRRFKRGQGFVPSDPKMDLFTGKWEQLAHPPIAPDQPVTPSRMVFESLADAKGGFDNFINTVAGDWGKTQAPVGALTDAVEEALAGWGDELTKRMARIKTEAGVTAQATRDAMLYDYRKSLGQVAAQYVSPFSYYHISASKQWFQNVAADPKWGAIYLDYKEAMAQKHAGLPDFWKQNIGISGLPGTDPTNPVFMNIEASINPIYQMVGMDYNDPERRRDWFSTVVDQVGSVLPGMYQPLSWIVAANLYSKGEEEAGNRWMGRLIPQTKLIKTISNALGVNIPFTNYNELDPFVGLLMDGIDPFEEKRALRTLATMPGLTEEQRIEAAHLRQGDVWDAAVRQSLSNRAIPEAVSFFMGVGYKPRTQSDVETDKFYTDYRKLIAARSIMPSDQYRDAWDALREKYPFMDTLLIGKKAGLERDTAMAYNVLNRIPPGELTDVAETLGVKPYMLEQFYANNGDLSKMTPSDRQRFMAAIVDLSSMLKMPSGATRQEWNSARETYASMYKELEKNYGADIREKMDRYWDLEEKDREAYLAAYPEVEKAMFEQNAYVVNTPILSAYYGSLDNISRYNNSQVYMQLEKEFGANIQDVWEQYQFLNGNEEAELQFIQKHPEIEKYKTRESDLQRERDKKLEERFGDDIYDKISEYNLLKLQDKDAAKVFRRQYIKPYEDAKKEANKQIKLQLESEFDGIADVLNELKIIQTGQNEEAKQFYREHNLDEYELRKDELFEQAEVLTVRAGRAIPDGAGYEIRPEFQSQSGYQQDAFNFTQTNQQAEMAQAIWENLTPAAQTLVQDSFETGADLPSSVRRQIEMTADKYGISQYEAMRLLGVEVVK